jgi:hypothetical protein
VQQVRLSSFGDPVRLALESSAHHIAGRLGEGTFLFIYLFIFILFYFIFLEKRLLRRSEYERSVIDFEWCSSSKKDICNL